KIARLTVDVSPENIDGLTVTVGGQPISSALIGAPRPTDPGKHLIEVSAPGYQTKKLAVELGEGSTETVTFELVSDGTSAATTQDTTNSEFTDPASKSSTRVIGWVTLGVGGALMAGGGVMGYLALGKKNDLNCD